MRPVLKQYKDAELGRTQGILMNERKSKQSHSISMYVQRVTAILVIIAAVTFAYFDSWMTEQTQLFINNFYYVQ